MFNKLSSSNGLMKTHQDILKDVDMRVRKLEGGPAEIQHNYFSESYKNREVLYDSE